MNITDVKITPINEDKLKAFVMVTLDNCFVIRDIKIISGTNGLFMAMPAKKKKDGTFQDLAHPINAETRKQLEKAVFDKYNSENIQAN